MKRKFELKFICLSLLMAGAGMFMTACSSDEDPVKPDTRGEENVVSDGDSVVLDADTLKAFENYAIKFQLQNADNQSVTSFKEGENFTFVLTVINSGNDQLVFPLNIEDMDFFPIYADDGTFLERPWDYITQSGISAALLNPKELISFTCKAFGERDVDTGNGAIQTPIALLKTKDMDPLPKGKYYTEFKYKINNEGESIVLRKDFRIE